MSIQEPSSELLHFAPSLFPLHPEAVVTGLRNLERSSTPLLSLIVAARGEAGPADSFYHNLPLSDLVDWHVDEGDFEADSGLLYKAGVLYGTDLTMRIAQENDMQGLRLSDFDAFDRSVAYLRDSYRGLDDENREPLNWRRQRDREVRYTGSDILTLANAALSDGVYERMEEIGCANPGKSSMAQHVGVIDGAILVDAYRSFSAGSIPQTFAAPAVEYIATFQDDRIPKNRRAIEIRGAHSFGSLEQLLGLKTGDDEALRIESPDLTGRIIHEMVQRCVQIGPNSFVTTYDVEAIRTPFAKARQLAGYLLVGATLDFVQGGLMHIPPGKIPIATPFMLLIGLLQQKHERDRAREHAEGYGLPLTIGPVEF